jgi:peptidoglycan/xylan/chitin deacetylase (PgdA/CDA1 family)
MAEMPFFDVLHEHGIKAGFFSPEISIASPATLSSSPTSQDGHYLGLIPTSTCFYCSWEDWRGCSSKQEFVMTFDNYKAMSRFGFEKEGPLFFIPPYEWHNETIAAWSKELGLTLFNFTPGTRSNADYTTPGMPDYRTSEEIFRSILDYEKKDPHGLNGFLLLIHIGTHPDRKDKFYLRLDDLIEDLRRQGYSFRRIDELLAGELRE